MAASRQTYDGYNFCVLVSPGSCRSKQSEIEASVLRRRDCFPRLDLDPMGAGMMCGPTVAVPDLMLPHQGDCALVSVGIRKHDVAYAFAHPRAGRRGAMAQEKDLQLRQSLLDHVPVVSMVILSRRFEQHDHTHRLSLVSAN